jgi:hypothetical protein
MLGQRDRMVIVVIVAIVAIVASGVACDGTGRALEAQVRALLEDRALLARKSELQELREELAALRYECCCCWALPLFAWHIPQELPQHATSVRQMILLASSPVYIYNSIATLTDRLCGLMVRSSWLQIRRPGFDFRHYQKKN